MNAIPEMIPISDLRARQNEIIAGLTNGPVILSQHSRGTAVLMAVAHYNGLMEEIEDLEDIIAVLRTELRIAKGED